MKRRLVAALACRNEGTRLYGKPLQLLTDGASILDSIIHAIKRCPQIDEIVLGISEGSANAAFVDVARAHGVGYVLGDPDDVLMRLIRCGRLGRASDVFRVTTECPWFAYEMLEALWARHVARASDITVTDRLPEGMHFEIYSQETLERSHERGNSVDRSEYCSHYPRTHPDEFKIDVVLPPQEYQRMDLRVTVDNPEDLILCRAIAQHYRNHAELLSVRQIVEFVDARPDLQALVRPYVVEQPLWDLPGLTPE